MSLIETILAFLFAIGPLIIFHELGHYTVARLCGVKVLRFSLGMGKVIFSRRFGPDQTEWVVSALPLGGYVKMLDSRDPDAPAMSEADAKREFTRQSVWRRIAIVAAGPIANFILAIAIFSALFMHGIEEPGTGIRFMAENTAAYQAGLRGGDRITAVNGKPIAVWSELRLALTQAVIDKTGVQLDVERAQALPGYAATAPTHLHLSMPASVFSALAIDSDVLGAVGLEVEWPKAMLAKVIANGPAARAGLQAGDVIESINGVDIPDGMALFKAISGAPLKPLHIVGTRAGIRFSLDATPEIDPRDKLPKIQVSPQAPHMVTRSMAPLESIAMGAKQTYSSAVLTVKGIGKMLAGDISWRNLTGVITIADYAGETARLGPTVYLGFIAFISLSLGVMNLLPIPVLDGGLLLYYSLEVLTGRPLPERIAEFAQRLGIGLLVALMALAVFNDVVRLAAKYAYVVQ